MAYKDKDRQKQANKQAAQRRRDRAKGMTKVIPVTSVTPENVILTVTPEGPAAEVPANYGLEDCACLHCKQDKGRHTLNHGAYKKEHEMADGEMNRVCLPGDVDYAGQVTTILD